MWHTKPHLGFNWDQNTQTNYFLFYWRLPFSSFPSDNIFIQIDGMDNSKSYLPRYQELSKDQVQKERLPSKISGCTIYNGWYEKNRKVLFYVNHDIFENGSNLVITLIHHLLQEFLSDWKKLPKKLHLNLDNCWKENKNRYLFSFLASLLELNIFEEITCNYLLVGHTGNEGHGCTI